jgi:hypothetical protein
VIRLRPRVVYLRTRSSALVKPREKCESYQRVVPACGRFFRRAGRQQACCFARCAGSPPQNYRSLQPCFPTSEVQQPPAKPQNSVHASGELQDELRLAVFTRRADSPRHKCRCLQPRRPNSECNCLRQARGMRASLGRSARTSSMLRLPAVRARSGRIAGASSRAAPTSEVQEPPALSRRLLMSRCLPRSAPCSFIPLTLHRSLYDLAIAPCLYLPIAVT